ncbi:WW domain-containing protein [Caerostris extrusa]|uniref:WW domain-containing protein n=1 Tax=Caerostris extrusa TaxID=172846 RepID=A0AAV4MAL6_CAEEX|nr:WW domain-containing protein [Caerostris extrusa]
MVMADRKCFHESSSFIRRFFPRGNGGIIETILLTTPNDSRPARSEVMSKDITPLESEIAVFFKEINELSVAEELLEETQKRTSSPELGFVKPSLPEADSQSVVDVPILDNKNYCQFNDPNKNLDCTWQEIHDSSTGYNYYWNVLTNEVTWDCPEEYKAYVQSLNDFNNKKDPYPVEDDENAKKNKEKKKKVPEGAIVPISYYGYSSTSDESDHENELHVSHGIKKPAAASVIKTNTNIKKLDTKCKSEEIEIIGPQLPPDFQFPPAILVAHEKNDQIFVLENEIVECVEVDSSLSPKTSNKIIKSPPQLDLNEVSSEIPIHETSMKSFQGVVEYDSFSDEDEDVFSSKTSLSKQNVENVVRLKIQNKNKKAYVKIQFPQSLSLTLNRNSVSLKVEDDLEEIDRALCEALDAKQSSKSSLIKSSTIALQKNQRDVESTTLSIISEKFQIKHEIQECVSMLTDKLKFWLASHSSHKCFTTLFSQLQTRIVDWLAGALESKYFMARLKELDQFLHHYEMSVVSGQWTCQWDRYGNI